MNSFTCLSLLSVSIESVQGSFTCLSLLFGNNKEYTELVYMIVLVVYELNYIVTDIFYLCSIHFTLMFCARRVFRNKEVIEVDHSECKYVI